MHGIAWKAMGNLDWKSALPPALSSSYLTHDELSKVSFLITNFILFKLLILLVYFIFIFFIFLHGRKYSSEFKIESLNLHQKLAPREIWGTCLRTIMKYVSLGGL